MMLEIINSCLCNSLHHNPNLVYALLYKRELFEQFRTHPSFQDIMQNLDTVSWKVFVSRYTDARKVPPCPAVKNYTIPLFLSNGTLKVH